MIRKAARERCMRVNQGRELGGRGEVDREGCGQAKVPTQVRQVSEQLEEGQQVWDAETEEEEQELMRTKRQAGARSCRTKFWGLFS